MAPPDKASYLHHSISQYTVMDWGQDNRQTLIFRKGKSGRTQQSVICSNSEIQPGTYSRFPLLWEQSIILDKELFFSSLSMLFWCIFPNIS